MAGLIIGGAALALGWLFARSDAPSAARLLLAEEVVEEDLEENAPGPVADRPSSGPQRGAPQCGVASAPPPPTEQVAALASGVVVIHHRPELDGPARQALQRLVDVHDRVLVVPEEGLDADVEATAWRHRYRQETVDPTDLERFVVGWGGRGPDPRPCP